MKHSAQQTTYRPTWAEVDLGRIRHNFFQIKKLIAKDISILAAVKANAYGHGILEVSGALVNLGVDCLGVGTTDEALLLRKNGFKIPILTLGAVLRNEVSAVVDNNITQTVASMELANAIDCYAKDRGKKAKVHIKIDTGMGRIGIWHEEAINLIKRLARLNNIEIEGIFSHFPSSDDNEVFTRKQIEDFSCLIEELEELGMHIRYRHMANSVAIMNYKDSHMNLIRPGLMLYGLYPGKDFPGNKIDLKPALTLKSRIVFIKDVPQGRRISYGSTHITERPTRIATIPIGYGDGLNRLLSNRGCVLIKGKRAPIIGRICMDQIMVDVGHIPGSKLADEVVLIGTQKREKITAEEIAHLCNTIPYEVACWFDNRIPRRYKKIEGA